MQSTTGTPMYALQDVPGKGKGLVAMERISKGARILSEKPIITYNGLLSTEEVRAFICQQVESLSNHQRRALLSMHNVFRFGNDVEQYLGILKTNSLPIEEIGVIGGIFLEACRINHACDNNALGCWNKMTNQFTVHALREIAQDEEITITYVNPLSDRNTRQAFLWEHFKFACACSLCSLPLAESRESDQRLREIRDLNTFIENLDTFQMIFFFALPTLRHFDRLASLYSQQGLEDVGFADTHRNAANLVIANSDLARGRIFAARAASLWKMVLGADSSEAAETVALARDPSTYEFHGVSKLWESKIDDVPQGLEPSDFEDWLWRRKWEP